MEPIGGKNGSKRHVHHIVDIKQMVRAQYVVVSSLQHGENTAFFSSFSLVESPAKVFCRLFLWNFKEKASTIFYGTAL